MWRLSSLRGVKRGCALDTPIAAPRLLAGGEASASPSDSYRIRDAGIAGGTAVGSLLTWRGNAKANFHGLRGARLQSGRLARNYSASGCPIAGIIESASACILAWANHAGQLSA